MSEDSSDSQAVTESESEDDGLEATQENGAEGDSEWEYYDENNEEEAESEPESPALAQELPIIDETSEFLT